MKKSLNLFMTFFKIGFFTFGGGYAMISVIENECVNKNSWISKEDMNELIVLSESTPGPIAINSSTFIGYRVNKALGSIIATLAVTLPSLIIITLISMFLTAFKDNLFINILFQSIRASVVILMSFAFFNLSKNTRKNILFYVLLISSFVLNFVFNVKSIYIVISSLVFAIIYHLSITKKGGKYND